jgi:hypothetical protein
MTHLRILILCCLTLLPLAATADLNADDLPQGAVWYLHADLEQMRASESGGELYGWFESEVLIEIDDELGINVNDEIDRVTAFSDSGDGAVIVVEGAISNELRDSLLDLARREGDLEERSHGGRDYFLYGEENSSHGAHGMDSLEDGGFFTFAVDGKFIAASDEQRLRAMIDSKGRIVGAAAHDDALFVLTADKQFVQAGMRTGAFADDDDDWDSNIIRNTEQAALLVSDQDGLIAVEAKLLSRDALMTRSIGNIVNGLISLQAFNSDMEPAIASVLLNTKVSVTDKVLSISTVLEPAAILKILED